MKHELIHFILGRLIGEEFAEPKEWSLKQRCTALNKTLRRTYAIFAGKPGIGTSPANLTPNNMNDECNLGDDYTYIAIFWAAWKLMLWRGKAIDDIKTIMDLYYKEIDNLMKVNDFVAP